MDPSGKQDWEELFYPEVAQIQMMRGTASYKSWISRGRALVASIGEIWGGVGGARSPSGFFPRNARERARIEGNMLNSPSRAEEGVVYCSQGLEHIENDPKRPCWVLGN